MALSKIESASITSSDISLNGRLTTQAATGKQLTLCQWGDLSAADGGQTILGGNTYIDKSSGLVKYSNTHANIGAVGVSFNYPSWNQGTLFSSGTTTATAGNTFTVQPAALWGAGGMNYIKFDPNQQASSDANALDDYEEGTYTTTITLGTGSISTSYANSLTYTKIGRQVTVTGRLYNVYSTSNVGTFYFTVPFAISGYNEKESASMCQVIRATTTALTGVQAGYRIFRAMVGTNQYTMQSYDGSNFGDFGTTSPHIIINLTYFVD